MKENRKSQENDFDLLLDILSLKGKPYSMIKDRREFSRTKSSRTKSPRMNSHGENSPRRYKLSM